MKNVTLAFLVVVLLCVPSAAHASFLSPEAEDKLATIIALVVIFVVPVVLITLFWLVHILPEKIAHQRHHPQFEAIRTLCLLSLLFGGLLWPLAWIWAYSKPVFYKLAYGTGAQAAPPVSPPAASELTMLRAKVDALEAKVVGHEVH
jgi:CBS domain containing-hemolysin-like protein